MFAENLLHIGKIAKLHGTKGEALFIADTALPKSIKSLKYFFLLIDGLPVPFLISYIQPCDNTSAVIRLADTETADDMEEYVGLKVMIENPSTNKPVKSLSITYDIQGFVVSDTKKGNIGTANKFLNYGDNVVLQIFQGKKEILIPVNENIIKKINRKSKIILVNCPEGLIDLYL